MSRTRRWSSLAAAAGVVVATALVPVVASGSAQASDQRRDGRTEATALASCWEVKQVDRAARDGLYWLYTPALGRPQQFRCDMTTDGGGWVLIGRGRQGWDFTAEGQGTPSGVARTATGPAAFAPQHLTNDLVDGLLDHGSVAALPDGLRLRRAANAAGTRWQEVRLTLPRMTSWSWALGGGYPVGRLTVDGADHPGGSSGSVCADNGYACVITARTKTNTYAPGFEYGPDVTGTTSPASYLWARADGGGAATPFAQAYLRPKLRFASLRFPSVGSRGLGGVTNRVLFDDHAMQQSFGVSGLANGFSTERDTEVRSMAQIGGRMFVGGNFARVDDYAHRTHAAQSYLAAFDVSDGAWIPTFRPTFNGKVNVVVKLPSGLLAVGGEFTRVNGRRGYSGLAVLSPTTGAPARGAAVSLQYRGASDTRAGSVTALSVHGSWLYIGGTFTHVAGGAPLGGYVYAKRGARLGATSFRPDPTWNPDFNAAPIFVLASPQGDRVYYGGFFTTMNAGAVAANGFAVVTATSPARPVPGLHPRVADARGLTYQQAAAETGTRLWLAGSEHAFFDYVRADFSLLRPVISRSDDGPGGDFQAAVITDGVAYGSCHCRLSYVYGGSRTWNPPTAFDRIDTMRYIAAFDVNTGRDLDDYLPWIRTRADRGPWALTVDSNRCLWVGGDLTQTKRARAGGWQSSGGFARFCHADTAAPSVPAHPALTVHRDRTVSLSWRRSTDAGVGGVAYTVFRDNDAVATVTRTSATLPAVRGTSRYAVRAIDRAGNTSATTRPIPVTVR